MPMELWTAATPNGWKVSIMFEELREAGVDLPELEVHTVDLMSGEQFSESYVAINPNQKIPALVDGDLRLMESCAILQYLAEKYPTPLLPLDETKWPVLQWVTWQAANLGPVFGNKLSYTRYLTDVDEMRRAHPLERFTNEAQRLLKVMAKQLDDNAYLLGDQITIADIAIFPWVRGWKWSKIDITGYQNIVEWVRRVRARPAVQRGLQYGIAREEVDQWSADTKQRYAKLGASMASNAKLDRDG
ncbi:MAG: glutathione S-transferase N-terminal domain-containing protein [Pseudomonadota bacterium]